MEETLGAVSVKASSTKSPAASDPSSTATVPYADAGTEPSNGPVPR